MSALGLTSNSHCVGELETNGGNPNVSIGGRCQSQQIDACYPTNLPTFPLQPDGESCELIIPYPVVNPCCENDVTVTYPGGFANHNKKRNIGVSNYFLTGLPGMVQNRQRLNKKK